MKVEITQTGCRDNQGALIPVGTVLTIKGNDLPGYLVNKCRVVSEGRERKTAVVNPAADGPITSETDRE